jgi:hypothetical protein
MVFVGASRHDPGFPGQCNAERGHSPLAKPKIPFSISAKPAGLALALATIKVGHFKRLSFRNPTPKRNVRRSEGSGSKADNRFIKFPKEHVGMF